MLVKLLNGLMVEYFKTPDIPTWDEVLIIGVDRFLIKDVAKFLIRKPNLVSKLIIRVT